MTAEFFANLQTLAPASIKLFSVNGVWTADGATVVGKCVARSHVHRYFIRDIENGVVEKCKTCAIKSRPAQAILAMAEKLFGAPFVLINEDEDYGYTLEKDIGFLNPILKIVIVCRKGQSPPDMPATPYLTLAIDATTRKRAIRGQILTLLRKPGLSPFHQAVAARVGASRTVQKAQLPITTHLADNNKFMQTNRILASTISNIADDADLYLENC